MGNIVGRSARGWTRGALGEAESYGGSGLEYETWAVVKLVFIQ